MAQSSDFSDFMIVRSAARAQLTFRKYEAESEKDNAVKLPREVCDLSLDLFAYWLHFHHYRKMDASVDVDDSIRDVFNNIGLGLHTKRILIEARRGGDEERLDVIKLRYDLLMLPIKKSDFVSEPDFLILVEKFLKWTSSRHAKPKQR